MDAINEAVVRRLKDRKGGEDVLPMWERIWTSYRENGPAGVDALIEHLLDPDIGAE